MTTSALRAAVGLVLVLGLGSCRSGFTTAPEGAGALGKFDKVWQDFDEHYAFFDYGGFDWAALRDQYRPRITPSTSDRELAAIIGGMIGELHDYHAELTTGFGVFGPPSIPYEQHFVPAIVRAHYFAAPAATTPSGKIAYAPLVDGTGFVYIGSFRGDGWGAEIETALRALGDVPALVIDIRNNGGGNEAVAQVLASRFYDKPRVYRSTRFRDGPGHGDFTSPSTMSVGPGGLHFGRPVALITNRFNGSSAEEFVLMLRILPTVVTVGDTTLGLGSNPLQIGLSNGWTYRVPQSMQSTPDGFVYQFRGLPPAVPVPWSAADTAAGRDPYLEAALATLRKTLTPSLHSAHHHGHARSDLPAPPGTPRNQTASCLQPTSASVTSRRAAPASSCSPSR